MSVPLPEPKKDQGDASILAYTPDRKTYLDAAAQVIKELIPQFLKILSFPSCKTHRSLHPKPANILVVTAEAVKLSDSEADHLFYLLGIPTEKPA